ncbi:hypothetical protein [Bdellovibrio bacteriovorus]|uniref:Uncharacterized protein n=1 Tax=Bdellovibrio bacteriovorus str. Tiberius TaxID=1069642 RepID=K7YVU0_BDEBC|nr:hypothetical protein [Bdellovibrio bacteriovorus]AFY00810.1 hypothetical protein Bdt_1110 [Bdellovibrio bacteriovorus str. Tiberius]
MNNGRRGFLKKTAVVGGSILTAGVVETLLSKIGAGFIQQARAESLGMHNDTRRHIAVWLYGGPPRYAFDQWVKAYDGDNIVSNPYVATAFTKSGSKYSGMEYKTFKYNGFNVPHLFSLNLKDGQGNMRPAVDVLDNMLIVRGFGTGFDGHDTNKLLVQIPVTGLPSMSGLLADQSERLFASIQFGRTGVPFSSQKNKAVTIAGSGYLNDLMRGFALGSDVQGISLGKEQYSSAYDNTMAYLKSYARSNRLGASILNKNLENAAKKMKEGISDADAFWAPAVSRYRNAIEGSAQLLNIAGINDGPILAQNLSMQDLLIFGMVDLTVDGKRITQAQNVKLANDFDLGLLIRNLKFNDFAEQMALAEYCIVKDLTSSVLVGATNFNNINVRTPTGTNDAIHDAMSEGKRNLPYCHTDMDNQTHAPVSVMLSHGFYSGILGGILEMRDALKKQTSNGVNLWDESVIQVSSEFARNVDTNGKTTPHGFQNMVTSAFSGAIKRGPYLVGNILQRTGTHGTNGYGAAIGEGYPVKGIPGPAMVNATLAQIMRVKENPWENTAPSLIDFNESTGVVSSRFGKAKVA